jgi:hypothetical protein
LTASTIVNGPKPFVGENVEVQGTGSPETSVTASEVWQISSTPVPSSSPSPTATPFPAGTATPGPIGSPIPLPSGVFTQTGTINAISGSKLTINAGSGCGSMYVYLSSSTTVWTGSPQIGQYGEFVGTGTRCSSENATAVTLSSSALPTVNVSGTVAASTGYGFTLNASGSDVPIVLSSSTVVFGATLSVGSTVTVTGAGSTSTAITATQIAVQPPPTPTPAGTPTPTPGPISTTHVMTAAIVYGYGGIPTSVPLSSISPYVSWAQTPSESYAASVRAAGIKVALYVNFWRNYVSDNPIIGYTDLEPGGAHAAAEATDCSGTPIVDPSYGGGYEADPRTSAALGHAQVVVDYRTNQYTGNYDALFSDDTATVYGVPELPCNYVESTYDAAVNAVDSALAAPMWINALGGAPNPVNALDLLQPSNVIGAMCEICYDGNNGSSDVVQTGTGWENIENAEIGTISQHKIFWDYPRATGDAASETGLRIYAYASFLLGYDPSYAMIQESLSTPSQFPVMPETGLVALNPLTTQSGVSGYLASGGAYFREFADCYYRGAFVAKCAVTVNPTAGTVPVPSTSYGHSLALSGYGVYDGGTVSFAGPATTQLAPGTAAILFP